MQISPNLYEKLGAFYLGRESNLKTGVLEDSLVLYDSKDLTTHAVVVGMTGSGKTGLCVSLLEEAALDNIPALVIDPKGDISNLLLTFPNLTASEFRPWINEDEARTKGVSADDYAASQAELWKKGLASWGQDGERIRRLQNATDITVYTPGSDAGVPISVLSSFDPPSTAVMQDGDALRDQIETTVTGLLSLLGINADPLQSPEHILLSNVVAHFWKAGKRLGMADLIHAIQDPPFDRVGVMDLESFLPGKERFALANRLNNLLASPGFETWMTGVPMDIDKLLYGPTGSPRIAICSIAHLSDSERQFFVSLLLNQAIGWMRSKAGTTSLRAILYIDELFGYMPPVANPPTKQPLLTLLKQARAYGLGLVLATQNPVDLDYKGLSNTGTWFIGRLQTERDKMRVLEGLEGAGSGGSFDRGEMEETLAGLGKRVFLMHNVHEPAPIIFQTRWAMSYLCGPLTRLQIKDLMSERKSEDVSAQDTGADADRSTSTESRASRHPASNRPVVPPDVDQLYVRSPGSADVHYEPHVLCSATVNFVDSKKDFAHQESVYCVAQFQDGPEPIVWDRGIEISEDQLAKEPAEGASWDALPADATRAKNYAVWGKDFADELYRTRTIQTFSYEPADLFSRPGESEREFRIRISDLLREERDEKVAAMRDKYARKLATAAERVRKAEQKVEKEQDQAQSAKMQSIVGVGTTLLSAVLGRKAMSSTTVSKASTAIRGFNRSSREKQDVTRALEDVHARQEDLESLQRELEDEVNEIEMSMDPATMDLENSSIKPRRSDIEIHYTVLAWMPD